MTRHWIKAIGLAVVVVLGGNLGSSCARVLARARVLAQIGRWLVDRGEVPEAALKDVPKEIPQADIDRWSIDSDTPVGRLRHLGPTVRLSETPPCWARPSVPVGYNEPAWPARTPA